MAPHRRSAAHRAAGLTTTVVVEHLVLACVVDITATAMHLPTGLRIGLTIACLVSHWQMHLRRR